MLNMSDMTANTTVVPVTGYSTTGSQATTGATAGSTWTFLGTGHKQRVRKSGTITKIRFKCDKKEYVTGIVFRVFRYNGVSYDQVGSDSETIGINSLADNTWGEFTLASPITGVKVGDYPAVAITASGGTARPLITRTGLDVDDYSSPNATTNKTGNGCVFDTPNSGYSMEMEFMSTAPLWVIAGESTAEGADECRSFLSSVPDGLTRNDLHPERNMLGYLEGCNSTLFNYINVGQGSTTLQDWVDSLTTSRVLPFYPRYCLFTIGINDSSANTSLATMRSNLIKLTQLFQANGIIPVFTTAFHAQSGTPAQKKYIQDYNRLLKIFCSERGLLCADVWSAMADSVNPDIRASVYGTGPYHPNSTGYKAAAACVWSALMGYSPQIPNTGTTDGTDLFSLIYEQSQIHSRWGR